MADLLDKVKASLGLTGNYHDETLQVYIDEVQQYMIDAGVPEDVATSDKAAGVVARGVSDLWNYSNPCLSQYFYQRVAQLASGGGSDVSTN